KPLRCARHDSQQAEPQPDLPPGREARARPGHRNPALTAATAPAMKWLLVVIVLLVGIAIGYPLLNEDASNLCGAFERRLTSMVSARNSDPSTAIFLNSLQSFLSNGSVASSIAKQRSPYIPPSLTCGVAYWRVPVDS